MSQSLPSLCLSSISRGIYSAIILLSTPSYFRLSWAFQGNFEAGLVENMAKNGSKMAKYGEKVGKNCAVGRICITITEYSPLVCLVSRGSRCNVRPDQVCLHSASLCSGLSPRAGAGATLLMLWEPVALFPKLPAPAPSHLIHSVAGAPPLVTDK